MLPNSCIGGGYQTGMKSWHVCGFQGEYKGETSLNQFDFVTSVPIKYTLRSLYGRHFMTAKYKSLKVGSKEPASSPLSNGTKISPIGSLKIFISPKNEVGGGQLPLGPSTFAGVSRRTLK